ncbi:MAG: PQQ-binding-like beta-propeller repeat protein [Lentimicrobiaceae bacterium]|nr:PQQ-binding-like beta-propeller repeat protein [Lentimicrobiaceae bacterium]
MGLFNVLADVQETEVEEDIWLTDAEIKRIEKSGIALLEELKKNVKTILRETTIFRTVIFLCAVVFYGCKELPPAEAFDPSNSRLHVVWSKPFYADSSQVVVLAPIVADRYVAVVGRSYSKLEDRMVVFDKSNGERHSAWQNGVKCETNNTVNSLLVGGNNNDILFCATNKSLHAFSIPTGQSLWTAVYENYGYPTLFGSSILAASLVNNICYADRYNAATGQKTNLFSFTNEYIYTIEWAVERNDTLLFFLGGRNAYCYNLTRDSIVWKNTTLYDNGDNYTAFHPVIVENKYVLFQYEAAVGCLNFLTGELIWRQNTQSAYSCPILYCDGKVVVRPSSGNVSCYDVHNGNLLWKNTDLELLNDKDLNMDIYKGNIYLVTRRGTTYDCPGFLHCLSLTTGVVNWFDPGPDKGIYENLTIDQQTGYLYCHSRQSVMCIDLTKTPTK